MVSAGIPGIAACLCLLFNLGYASSKFFDEPVWLLLKNKIIVKRKRYVKINFKFYYSTGFQLTGIFLTYENKASL